jgi:hypothetical protein
MDAPCAAWLELQATKSLASPAASCRFTFSLGDAFPRVELVDCRKKFDLLNDFLQGNFIGQLANCIQDNLR